MTAPSEQKLVQCPTCGKPVEWSEQQRWRPFCSERCKLIDLGEWLDESNRIPGEVTPGTGEDVDA
ncbi:MAG: DNA gyrase inhibitor YacG [Halobacteria archaeon]|nr:DNA gyrase inhibitor YacG [Halobacteria archaeon]